MEHKAPSGKSSPGLWDVRLTAVAASPIEPLDLEKLEPWRVRLANMYIGACPAHLQGALVFCATKAAPTALMTLGAQFYGGVAYGFVVPMITSASLPSVLTHHNLQTPMPHLREAWLYLCAPDGSTLPQRSPTQWYPSDVEVTLAVTMATYGGLRLGDWVHLVPDEDSVDPLTSDPGTWVYRAASRGQPPYTAGEYLCVVDKLRRVALENQRTANYAVLGYRPWRKYVYPPLSRHTGLHCSPDMLRRPDVARAVLHSGDVLRYKGRVRVTVGADYYIAGREVRVVELRDAGFIARPLVPQTPPPQLPQAGQAAAAGVSEAGARPPDGL